jgi:hypothetical protein
MSRRPDSHSPLTVLQRTLAGVLSATILLLTLLAVCPSAHERLHAHAGDSEHVCAITLYAQGVTATVCHVAVLAPSERCEVVAAVSDPDLVLVAPRYWLRPLRGPPVS